MTRSQETERVVQHFDSAEQAASYGDEFNSKRHQRTRNVIVDALAAVPAGARVLDLPCGTGRLLPLLMEKGFQYVGADSSEHMVEATRKKLAAHSANTDAANDAELHVQDVTAMSFADDSFDAAVVNRLFHHFTQRATRVAALTELRRVTNGPVFVFFLNAWTWRGMAFRARHLIGEPATRWPITVREFRENGKAAGLKLTQTWATRGRYAKEWYARFDRCP
ncbi:MAG: methyltransferase domain-containing protein [Pseudomonadota bacterium]